jgi:4-hydroxy-3-polyprenylbenzoate decarboxylase
VSIDNISQLLSAIDRIGELSRITEPVRAKLELCEIADRVMKQPGGGNALYFENVLLDSGERSPYPVVINLFGSMRRMSLALGVDNLDEIGERITEMLDLKVPEGLVGKLAMLPRLLEIGKFPPRVRSGKPPCQEVVLEGDKIDLSKLPIITCWPDDGGPYITLPMVISKDPKRGIRNVGMYRVQVLGPRTLAMHWQRHKVGAAHWREMAEKGERMPVVIAVGADPASVYSASAPLPPTIDEFLFAGFLRKSPVSLAKAVTCELEVPTEAEFVIEGYIDPAEALVVEGPFGDHTGFYSEADLYPQVHVTALTMRKNPVYATTIVGRPPMEDFYLGHATERIFLPLLKLLIPDIVDYDLPEPGVFHNCVIVSINKRYPKHAQKVMNAVWGAHLLSLTKLIVVVDDDCDPSDYHEVAFRAFGNVDYAHDLVVTQGPVDHLDHASYQQFWGGKAGVDATRKLPTEGYTRGWPTLATMSPEVVSKVDRRWREYEL